MTRATSVFLDLLRLGAAFTVFLAHTATYWNPRLVGPMQYAAHQAVVVFFVLSGYVIAFAAGRARDARAYTVARLSRLYSVVVPALLLTALAWPLGRELDPSLYAHYAKEGAALRYAASGLFLNETWFLNAYPPANTPFWSLGYEAWFYLFAGIAVYVRPRRWKAGLLLVCALAAGPKVLLLLPVWLAGAAAFVWRDRLAVKRPVAAACSLVCAGLTVWAMATLPDAPATLGAPPWYFSGRAWSDGIVGLGLALGIWFFARSVSSVPVPEGVVRVVRWCANHTFSLYLYHAPLVILTLALIPPLGMGVVGAAVVMGSLLVVIAGLAAVTEGQRLRWQRGFEAAWDRFAVRKADGRAG